MYDLNSFIDKMKFEKDMQAFVEVISAYNVSTYLEWGSDEMRSTVPNRFSEWLVEQGYATKRATPGYAHWMLTDAGRAWVYAHPEISSYEKHMMREADEYVTKIGSLQ